MAGVGKLLKQAQKMQKKIADTQEALANEELEFSSGGGAVVIKINGAGEFLDLKIDEEFLKEEASLVQETLLASIQEAASKAKAHNEAEMAKATEGFNMPGLM